MPPRQGTSEGRFLLEIDGIAAVMATEVSGLSTKHTPFKLHVGNDMFPRHGRGSAEVTPVKVKHAHALNETGAEFRQWLSDFINGDSVERRGARLIVLDEDGQSEVEIYELLECVPTEFMVETQTAGGTNANMFSFEIQPRQMIG